MGGLPTTRAGGRESLEESAVIAAQHAPRGAVFIGRPSTPRSALAGRNHPLAIARVATVVELSRQLGWLDDGNFRASPQATPQQLRLFHAPAYVAALRHADARQQVEPAVRERHHIGNFENPVFPGVYAQAASAVGGSILAADLALDGHLPFHPAGGTHHGQPGHASGFCFFNDPVFAILRLLERGITRVAYVDLDAHHGDGVEAAFAGEPRVRCISIHESDRWPHSGAVPGRGPGGAFNLPVPRGLNDDEFAWLLDEAVLPLVSGFDPGALVITCGADALAGDPLASMELSNGALWDAVDRLRELAAATVVLGGGGYNPWTVARCWTGLWGRLSGHPIPSRLPEEAQSLLAALDCDLVDEENMRPEWTSTLADPPRHGRIREEIRELAVAVARPQ